MSDGAGKIAALESELEETYRSITHLTNELAQANELLRTNNQELTELYDTAHQFVDNVSHEFRTPLTVIKEFASILRDGIGGSITDEQHEYLEIIINRADDLNLLVNDMLDISKVEAGFLGMFRQECRVEGIVEHIRAVLERKAAASGATLSIAIDDALPTVYCDADKIGQVIINLVVNAFKFSGEGGEVVLWARDDPLGSQIVLGVTDNGPGIAPENVQAIFKRFKQVGGDIRASTKGFGLGLNIAKELVQLNFGDIEVESELGKGSMFFFTVPTFDPPRILERFMKRIEHFRNSSSYVSLITARIEPNVDFALLDYVERFLQEQLRRSDLLFRTLPGTWLVCAPTNRQGLDQLIARVDKAQIEANRNRPDEELPPIYLDVNGTWRILDQGSEFVRQFMTDFGADDANHVELGRTLEDTAHGLVDNLAV